MAGSVHDTLVKAVFSRPENANGLFRAVLPAQLLAALDPSTTELLLARLRELRSDAEAVMDFVRAVADLLALLPDDDRVLCFLYILEVAEPDPGDVQAALKDVAEPRVQEGVMTAAEKLRNEGRVEGQRTTLLRLLRTLFPGQMQPELDQRVMTADTSTLDNLDRSGRRSQVRAGRAGSRAPGALKEPELESIYRGSGRLVSDCAPREALPVFISFCGAVTTTSRLLGRLPPRRLGPGPPRRVPA